MFTKNKKLTAISILILLTIAVFSAACTANTQPTQVAAAETTAAGGGITVIGQGEAFGQPDRAQIQVGVDIFAATVSEATSENEAAIQGIMAALTAQGIAKEDIQTTNYSLWAEQIYGDRGPEGISGYRVNNQVNITIHDIDKVGEILAAVTDAGANNIFGIQFSVSDPAALEAEARAAAIADARERAGSLAELTGVSLGDVTVVSEIIGQPMPLARGGFDMAVAESAAPSISPGQLSHHVQIQVTFAIN